uniref:Uncharacterized protein n=1 Tax=Ciona savignyi TaxID=51511 RepID=H2ZQ25_CIOSA
MATCLSQKISSSGFDFNSLVDYGILCSFWYLNTDGWLCSNSADTAQ